MASPRMKIIMNLFSSLLFIILGLYLISLQSYFDTISAIFVAGILIFLMGLTTILAYVLQIVRKYWAILNVNPPTVKPHHEIKSATGNSLHPKIPKKYCSVCGEIYTDSTIHDKCILCGSDLTVTDE